jgi:2-polyprenyl-3-methyl-5-hydroxy-6-metoxy-1,4-benzoquinol methylase
MGKCCSEYCGEVSGASRDLKKISCTVQDYYGKVLTTSKDLKTNACTAAGPPHPLLKEAIRRIPDPVVSQFYGCGMPIPLGIHGLRVLDLGSGSGRDSYICSALVGEEGSVVGVDMTRSQLEVRYHESLSPSLCLSHPFLCLPLSLSFDTIIQDLWSGGAGLG